MCHYHHIYHGKERNGTSEIYGGKLNYKWPNHSILTTITSYWLIILIELVLIDLQTVFTGFHLHLLSYNYQYNVCH